MSGRRRCDLRSSGIVVRQPVTFSPHCRRGEEQKRHGRPMLDRIPWAPTSGSDLGTY